MKNGKNILIAFLYISVFVYGIFLINTLNKIDAHTEEFGYIGRDALLETSTLNFIFNNGLIRIYNKDKLLTEGNGLVSSFHIKGILYETSTASWKIEKISPTELVATAQWPDLAVQEIWRLKIEEGRLSWQIDLKSKEDIEIKHLCAELSLKDKYKEWTNLNTHGVMPKLSYGQDYKQLSPNVAFRAIGFKGDPSLKEPLPYFIFDVNNSLLMNRVELKSSRNTYTKITSSDIYGFKDALFLQKNQTLFKYQLYLFDKEQDFTSYFKAKRASREISQGDLRLFFDQGRGYLFWKDKLLTEDEGIGIMHLYSNHWYTSSQETLWNYKKISANKIIIQGRVAILPISYILEFEIAEGNSINYKIDIEAYKNISLAKELFIVMIADAFSEYVVPAKGVIEGFPFKHIDSYGWFDVYKQPVDFTTEIGAVNVKDRDAIILHCSSLPGGYSVIISNTNKRHNARVLIHQKNGASFSVGRHTLFTGKIEISQRE